MTVDINHTHVLDVAMEDAWDNLHAHLPQLAPWLPHVANIEILKEQPISERRSSREYAWHVDEQVVPTVAKPFVKDHLEALHSHTLWHHDQYMVELRFYLDTVPGLLDCEGQCLFTVEEGRIVATISASIEIYPEKLPGVPAILGRSIRSAVEDVVEDAIRPPLEALPNALDNFLQTLKP